MALKTNATLTFAGYEVQDAGIQMRFLAPDPGPGEESYWHILLTQAELDAITTQLQLRNLVVTKLQRKYRAATIASKLDAFIGQSLTI